ncbi:MAG: hypothetical protein OXM87_07465 [Truepera sp.]|nr:hypothetical protein [Truepera sp.]
MGDPTTQVGEHQVVLFPILGPALQLGEALPVEHQQFEEALVDHAVADATARLGRALEDRLAVEDDLSVDPQVVDGVAVRAFPALNLIPAQTQELASSQVAVQGGEE